MCYNSRKKTKVLFEIESYSIPHDDKAKGHWKIYEFSPKYQTYQTFREPNSPFVVNSKFEVSPDRRRVLIIFQLHLIE